MNKKEQYNSEITKEDLNALGDKAGNLRHSGDSDEILKDRKRNVDFTGKDLDIPGSDQKHDSTALRDEENKIYGQGGERKANLESNEGKIK